MGGGTQRAGFGNGSVPKSMSKITTGREFTVEQAIAQVWGASRLVVLPPSAAPSFGSKAMITYNRPQGKTPARMMLSRMGHRVCFAATGACLMAPGCTQSLPRPVLSGKRRKVGLISRLSLYPTRARLRQLIELERKPIQKREQSNLQYLTANVLPTPLLVPP